MKQSFAWWSFTFGSPPPGPVELLAAAARVGMSGVEMLPPELWPAARDAGLELVTTAAHEVERGFNDRLHHAELGMIVRAEIERAAAGGVRWVIVFSGNAEGRPDDDAIAACAEGLAPLAEEAAAAGVGLLLELLNSKVDHPGYQCDRSWWALEVVRQVGSPALRVLYDAYHAQMMEGDLIRTIKGNLDLIGHVHTAGAPGRRDLDDRQEVNWRAIAGTLARRGYPGWVGHEFVPRADPVAALAHAHSLFARTEDAG